MWYRKSVLPGTGAGFAELKIGFFSQREDIFTHFIGLLSSSRHKGFARKN